jgi:hypothetical protein
MAAMPEPGRWLSLGAESCQQSMEVTHVLFVFQIHQVYFTGSEIIFTFEDGTWSRM